MARETSPNDCLISQVIKAKHFLQKCFWDACRTLKGVVLGGGGGGGLRAKCST